MSETTRKDPTRAQRAAMPLCERQSRLKNLVVEHDSFREATDAVARFHMPVKGGTPDFGSLFVLAGDPRTGKSFALERYARGFPAGTDDAGVVRPVVYVDLPIGANKASMVAKLAEALNVDCGRVKIDVAFAQVLRELRDRKVQLLLLDEYQEAFVTSRPTAIRDCNGLVRKILNLRSLNVVAAGLVETYRLMAKDAQLKGRGLLPHRIVMPYEWGSKQERDVFRLLCATVDDLLPFAQRSGLGSPWFAARLHWVTDGIIGHLKDFVHNAGCRALNEADCPKLTPDHFADAWDEIRPVGMTFNPFRDEMDQAPAKSVPPTPLAPGTGAFVGA